jgi:predicted TIM-barrel fold metal-dependent hydrolase
MDQVLFGSDYPYLRRDLAVPCRHEVATSAELAPDERRAILASNALNLFAPLSAHMGRSSKRSTLANRTKEQ